MIGDNVNCKFLVDALSMMTIVPGEAGVGLHRECKRIDQFKFSAIVLCELEGLQIGQDCIDDVRILELSSRCRPCVLCHVMVAVQGLSAGIPNVD